MSRKRVVIIAITVVTICVTTGQMSVTETGRTSEMGSTPMHKIAITLGAETAAIEQPPTASVTKRTGGSQIRDGQITKTGAALSIPTSSLCWRVLPMCMTCRSRLGNMHATKVNCLDEAKAMPIRHDYMEVCA